MNLELIRAMASNALTDQGPSLRHPGSYTPQKEKNATSKTTTGGGATDDVMPGKQKGIMCCDDKEST